MIQLVADKLGDLWTYGYFFPFYLSSLLVWVLWRWCFPFFFSSVWFRAHFICGLSTSISLPSSSIVHQILLQAQFSCPEFNYRLPSVKKLSFAAPATTAVVSALNVWLFWCVLLSRKKWYIYFLSGYKQEVIFIFKSVPLGQIRFFLMSQNCVRSSVLIEKIFCFHFHSFLVLFFFFFNIMKQNGDSRLGKQG